MSEQFITIGTFATEADATIAQGTLEASGVPAYLRKDDCGGMRPHMQLTCGIALQVEQQYAPTAIEILRTYES